MPTSVQEIFPSSFMVLCVSFFFSVVADVLAPSTSFPSTVDPLLPFPRVHVVGRRRGCAKKGVGWGARFPTPAARSRARSSSFLPPLWSPDEPNAHTRFAIIIISDAAFFEPPLLLVVPPALSPPLLRWRISSFPRALTGLQPKSVLVLINAAKLHNVRRCHVHCFE